MRDRILRLFAAIDEALLPQAAEGERLDLHVIGKAAVILFFGGEEYGALTSDVDVVQVTHPPERLLSLALKGFAKGTPGAARHGLYLESVLSGVPPLSAGFRKRCTPMPGDWRVLNVCRPEVHDLAASKLKRYAAKDQDDLRHLCGKSLLRADRLREALESAFLWDLEKDGDPIRERAFENLRRVEAFLAGERPDL